MDFSPDELQALKALKQVIRDQGLHDLDDESRADALLALCKAMVSLLLASMATPSHLMTHLQNNFENHCPGKLVLGLRRLLGSTSILVDTLYAQYHQYICQVFSLPD